MSPNYFATRIGKKRCSAEWQNFVTVSHTVFVRTWQVPNIGDAGALPIVWEHG